LQEQLRNADGEGRRLAQSERSLQELLGERAAQVQSLEDKHRHAREALDHYRQQHLAQRDQESQRHDSQLHQVQHELRGVRAELLTKQEELAQAYQGNERLVGELRALQRQDRQRDLQLQQLRQERADADNRHQNERVQLQTLTAEHSGLRERVKRHVLTERQHRRELRAQRQQNVHLQTLLDHLTTSPPPSDDQ
jgi:chromosome segregation ATPase